jgi:hypothetical protein
MSYWKQKHCINTELYNRLSGVTVSVLASRAGDRGLPAWLKPKTIKLLFATSTQQSSLKEKSKYLFARNQGKLSKWKGPVYMWTVVSII